MREAVLPPLPGARLRCEGGHECSHIGAGRRRVRAEDAVLQGGVQRDRAHPVMVYHVARPHCAELDVRARARRAVEIVDDAEVVRVGRQQQPQQPQHQSLAAAARRVGAVRTVDTFGGDRDQTDGIHRLQQLGHSA
eukprot:scaffold40339_cov68-Phaeocystis_antarctica.AAC.5